jgi:hypothetical protein
MIETLDEKDLAFANELEKYEGKWVAILNYGSDEGIIVSSGNSLKEAKHEAEGKGFRDVTLFKVPSTRRMFVP